MQSFGSFFNDNKALAVTLVLVAAIVGAAILLFLYRLLFGRRLHMAGGRTRQPRLGVVDAFDLDRQRQLVLIRRDNVEHLVMIGGPNDLVIESAFVRMQPNAALPLGGRDGSTGIAAPVAPMALPPNGAPVSPPAPNVSVDVPTSFAAPGPAGPATVGADRAAVPPLDLTDPVATSFASDPLADIPAPAPVPTPEPQPAAVPAPAAEAEPAVDATEPAAPADTPAPVAPEPTAPPARPASTLSRFASSFPPRQLGASGSALPPRPPLSSLRTPTVAGTPRTPTPGPRPFPSAPLSRGTSAASLRRDPVPQGDASAAGPGGPPAEASSPPAPPLPPAPPPSLAEIVPAVPLEPAPATAPPLPPPAPESPQGKPIPMLPTTLDTLESLEEEMAKLLGRPPSGAAKG